jgi:hypothetical protein
MGATVAERVRPDLIVRGATVLVLGPDDVTRQPSMPWRGHVHQFRPGGGLCIGCSALAEAAYLEHGR